MTTDEVCNVQCNSRICQHKQNHQIFMKATDNSATDMKAVPASHCAPAYSSVEWWQPLLGQFSSKTQCNVS